MKFLTVIESRLKKLYYGVSLDSFRSLVVGYSFTWETKKKKPEYKVHLIISMQSPECSDCFEMFSNYRVLITFFKHARNEKLP